MPGIAAEPLAWMLALLAGAALALSPACQMMAFRRAGVLADEGAPRRALWADARPALS